MSLFRALVLVVGNKLTQIPFCRAFSQFNYDLTTTNGSRFALVGNATAVTDTPLGQYSGQALFFYISDTS